MVDDHEDYETGTAPAAHGPSHEKDGDDEFSIAGLSGETAGLAAHKILPSIHHLRYTDVEAAAAAAALILIHKGDAVAHQNAPQLILDHKADAVAHQDAPALIETHRLVADAHHGRYTDLEAEAVADAQILTHKGDAVAHQDAPALIETHRLVAGAHHAYVEDTWTPIIRGSGVAGTYEIIISDAYYTRIGNLVFISMDITREAVVTGGGTGHILVTNFPFTCAADNSYISVLYHYGNAFTKDYSIIAMMPGTTQAVVLLLGVDGSQAVAPIGNFAANGHLRFALTYRV